MSGSCLGVQPDDPGRSLSAFFCDSVKIVMGILETGILKTFSALWRNSVKGYSYTLILSSYRLILQVRKNMQKSNYTFRTWGGNFIFFSCTDHTRPFIINFQKLT